MKYSFEIITADFKDCLLDCSKGSDTKNTIEEFDFIYVSYKKDSFDRNTLNFIGASENAVKKTIIVKNTGECESPVCFFIPKRLLQIVMLCTERVITISGDSDNGFFSLITTTGIFEFSTISANNAPHEKFEKTSFSIFCEFDSSDLIRVLKNTLPFASNDYFRPALCGVSIRGMNNGFVFDSTNSFILSKQIITMDINGDSLWSLIINTKGVSVLFSILKKAGVCKVNVYSNKKFVKFSFNNTEIILRLVNEISPNFDAIVPTNLNHKVLVNTKDFLASIKAVNVNGGNLIIEFKEDKINVVCSDISFGYHSIISLPAVINVPDYKLPIDTKVCLDATWLHQIIEMIITDDVCLSFFKEEDNYKDPITSAVLIKEEMNNNDLFLIMPKNIF